jgi:hypothetical protein
MPPWFQFDLLVRQNQTDYGLDHLLLDNRLHLLKATHHAPLFALKAKTLGFILIGLSFQSLNHRKQRLNYLNSLNSKAEVFVDKFELSVLRSLLQSVELFLHLLFHSICLHLEL